MVRERNPVVVRVLKGTGGRESEQLRHSDVNTTLGTFAAGDSRSYEALENM